MYKIRLFGVKMQWKHEIGSSYAIFLCLVSNHFVINCVNSFKEFHFEYSYWLVIYLIDTVEQNLEILNIFDMFIDIKSMKNRSQR